MKALAIDAATDTNTDEDRAIIQKTFDRALENINDIATTTNFNGKSLLDGSMAAVIQEATTATQTKTVYSTITETAERSAISSASITEDGVYELASDFNGTLEVSAQNVKIVGDGSTLSNITIEVTASNANLWIENLTITNSTNMNAIKFGSGTNTLIVKGTNTLGVSNSAAINIGGGLTIIGSGTITVQSNGDGAAIGTDSSDSSNANINIGDKVTVNASSRNGAGIGSGKLASVGDITIGGNAVVTASSQNGAGIGSGNDASVGKIIIGDNAVVNASSYGGAGIGGGYNAGSFVSITIGDSATVNASSRRSSAIGRGFFGTGDPNAVYQNVANLDTGLATLTEPDDPETKTTIIKNTVTETFEVPATVAEAVVIHTGSQAGQSLSVRINDMHTKSLRSKVPSEADNERLMNLKNDADKFRAFQELLNQVQDLTLDDINLRTREGINLAIRVIDGALDYALDQATNIGAYLQRLEHTLDNVTTTAENTQAAESVIRDADMAKEMTEYAKANILSQAAQSMLAQINQNSGNVISLLE